MYIIGVDPGKTGAAAYLSPRGVLMGIYAFKGDITRCREMKAYPSANPATFFIERVTASPNQGVTSAFTFGQWAEAVESAAIHSGSPIHMVRPIVWQNAIGVFSGGDKKKLYDHAIKLYPNEYKQKIFNQATSDAVLIAYYGWRYLLAQEDM